MPPVALRSTRFGGQVSLPQGLLVCALCFVSCFTSSHPADILNFIFLTSEKPLWHCCSLVRRETPKVTGNKSFFHQDVRDHCSVDKIKRSTVQVGVNSHCMLLGAERAIKKKKKRKIQVTEEIVKRTAFSSEESTAL